MKNETKAVLFAGLAVLSWSTVATAFKVALSYLSHFEMLLIACLTALVIFSLLITAQKKWKDVLSLSGRQCFSLALLGLLNPVVYYLTLFKAYNLLPAQVAQPVNYIWPILLLILLALFDNQKIPRRKYVGMVVSFSGVVIISWGSGQTGEMSVPAYGLFLAIMSSLLWAVYWMVNNRLGKHIDSMVSLFVSFLFGTLYLLLWAFTNDVEITSLPGILSGMYVGAFEMGIPFIFFGLAIRKTGNPSLINQLCYLAPFLSLFFISFILKERILFTTYIGLVLIIAGILFNQYAVKVHLDK